MAKMTFGGMVTIGDWARFHGTWGKVGVGYVLTRLADAGFKKVYWRTSAGSGQAMYPSRVTNAAESFQPADKQKYPELPGHWWDLRYQEGDKPLIDFSDFDAVAMAREFCQKLGLELVLWHEHAEDHGGVGVIGRMGLQHPEWFTKNRDGQASRCRFSWGIEAAMAYRLAWLREVMSYEPDAVCLDLVKSMESTRGVGCTPHWDEDGVWYCGYDEPIMDAFKQQDGRDPMEIPNGDDAWVNFRAGLATDYIRKVRQMQKSTFPGVRLGIFGCPSGREGLMPGDVFGPLADPKRSYLEDHETWTQEGLIDEFVGCHTTFAKDDPAGDIKIAVQDSRSRVHPPCRYLGTQIEVYRFREEAPIAAAVEAAAEGGCDEVVFFESTPLEANKTWEAAANIIKRFGA